MASSDPRHAYVRFYLQVVAQLEDIAAALTKSAKDTLEAVEPFRDMIATTGEPGLTDAPKPLDGLAKLWRPQDPAMLLGIVDVYDVVGRFTFQGEDDANLGLLRAIVRSGLDEVERQRRTLVALSGMPAAVTQKAEGLSQQEIAAAETALSARMKPFEPVAEQLRDQCGKVLNAVRIVPRPDLSRLQDAELLYQEYVRRMQSLYAAALPYLRRALQELCTVAEVEVPSSWPDSLPFANTLPAELVTIPPADSPAMITLRDQTEQCMAQDVATERALDELAVAQRRLEAEKLEFLRRDADALAEVEIAKNVVRWATSFDVLDGILQSIDAQGQQKQGRIGLVGQLYVQHQQLNAQVAALQADVTQRQAEVASTAASLEKLRGDEPAIFGKDDWRRRVDDLQFELSERTSALSQRQSVLAQGQNDLTSVAARAQAEQSQVALIDRGIEEAREKEQLIRKEIANIERQLDTQKPARRVTLAQADEYLARTFSVRNEVRGRAEQISAQQRRNQEEADRLAAQRRQLAAEKQRLASALEQASREAALAQKEALTALTAKRKAGFNQYVNQVLAPLEESLSQVDRIFIEPARRVLEQRSTGEAPRAGSLRAQAEGLAQALAQWTPRIEPVLFAQAEALKRVQSDFCEKVSEAVRAAWAA